jgi:hypothetical protein
MFRLPVDGEGLVHLDVLTGLHTPPAENALIRIVAIERVGEVLLVRLGPELADLVLHIEISCSIVDRAVVIIVVAHGAVEQMVLKDPVKRLPLRNVYFAPLGLDAHAVRQLSGARAHQRSVDMHHACVASLQRTHLGVIADLRQLCIQAIDQIDGQFSAFSRISHSVQSDLNPGRSRSGRVEQSLLHEHFPSMCLQGRPLFGHHKDCEPYADSGPR